MHIIDVVDQMFDQIPARLGEICENPVTGAHWVYGEDPIGPQKEDACRALGARIWFAGIHPDFPPLPLNDGDCQILKRGGIDHIFAWYAQSLQRLDFDFANHPSFEDYARGVMASPLAPNFITDDVELQNRFPSKELPGLGNGLVWRRPKLS